MSRERKPEGEVRGGGTEREILCGAALTELFQMTPARLSRLLRRAGASTAYELIRSRDALVTDWLLGLNPSRRRTRDENGESIGGREGAGERRDEPSGQKGGQQNDPRQPSVPPLLERRRRCQGLVARWSRQLVAGSLGQLAERLTANGVTVLLRGTTAYPARLERSSLPPEVLFAKGDLSVMGAATVGIVGTRRASQYGLGVAQDLGSALAARGVSVVSGLAVGIDGAAHAAALAKLRTGSGPIAVVGGGVDQVYPDRNRVLWQRVVENGVLLSEAPLGAAPLPWRFPLRNRMIAALSDVMVIVESSRQGGSMHTAQAADSIGAPLLAVPGSIRSRQSEGTNALIAEGGACLLQDLADVLVALERVQRLPPGGSPMTLGPLYDAPANTGPATGLGTGRLGPGLGPGPGSGLGAGLGTDPGAASAPFAGGGRRLLEDDSLREVYDFVGDGAVHVDDICEQFGLSLSAALVILDRLDEQGLVRQIAARWTRT